MGNKPWTQEEINYLQDKWGELTIPGIAKKLGRTVTAIKIKAVKMELGRHLHCGEVITLNQLFNGIGKGSSYGWLENRWCRYGLPVKLKKSIKRRYRVIKIEDFWEWAKQHKDIIDFSQFEKNMLGAEPSWVEEKRHADIAAAQYKKTPWTKEEDIILISMVNAYRYSYRDVSERLRRTAGAVKRRMIILGIKQRPLKAENHILWSDKEVKDLIILKDAGYGPEVISEKLGGKRSALAVRGKLERMELVDNHGETGRVIPGRC